jgi:hypothetical protein
MPDASHTITTTRPHQLVEIALPFLLGGEPLGEATDAASRWCAQHV